MHLVLDVTAVSARTATAARATNWNQPGAPSLAAQQEKYDKDRSSSLPVQSVHEYYPVAVEDGGRLAPHALRVIWLLAVLIAVVRSDEVPSSQARLLRTYQFGRVREFLASCPGSFRSFVGRVKLELLQRVSTTIHGGIGGYLHSATQKYLSDALLAA